MWVNFGRRSTGFGRTTTETDPDGRYRDITYDYCTGVAGGSTACSDDEGDHGALRVLSIPRRAGGSVQSGPAVGVILDKLGRQIVAGTEAANGTDWSLSVTRFDTKGNVDKVTRPYLSSDEATDYTEFDHDVLGRVTSSVTSPDSREDTFTYNGKITTHTKDIYGKNQATLTELNDQGLIKKVTEPGSVITQYAYNAIGELLTLTDPAGNQIINEVDNRGRVTYREDPSLGGWGFAYNVMSELIEQTDAKSQTQTYSYDRLGRMTQLVAPGMTSTFTFDTATNGKGRLKEMVTTAGNKRAHTYDSLGRVITTMFTIDSSTAGYTYTYNTDNQLATVEYPSGYTVRQEYTSDQRYLQYVKDNSNNAALWTANERNAEGRYTQSTMNMSNAYTVNRTFDEYGRVTAVGAGTSNTIANFAFTYDKLGNLTQRTDTRTNPSESVTESFVYDSLNRLKEATIDEVTKYVFYNSVGNITSKTQLGSEDINTYTYPPATDPRPYAVLEIDGEVNDEEDPEFAYDDNGNMTSGAGRTVTWTSYNMVASVTEGTTLTYTYDAEHQRIKQSDGTVTTYYLNDPLTGASSEFNTEDSGTFIDYLMAGGERVGVRTRTTSPSAVVLHGLVPDHAGSVAVVTDTAGAVVQRLAYDAWGRRRNPDGSEDPAGSITAPTSRGYTGHEHLPNISLINMNARIYDPEIGRFMSADPIIPTPLRSQSLNRYSYVENNPGSLVDPSGHYPENIPEIVVTGTRGDGGFPSTWNRNDYLRDYGSNYDDGYYSSGREFGARGFTQYKPPGLASVKEGNGGDGKLHDVAVGGDPNLGQNASSSGSKFASGLDSKSADNAQKGQGWWAQTKAFVKGAISYPTDVVRTVVTGASVACEGFSNACAQNVDNSRRIGSALYEYNNDPEVAEAVDLANQLATQEVMNDPVIQSQIAGRAAVASIVNTAGIFGKTLNGFAIMGGALRASDAGGNVITSELVQGVLGVKLE